MLTLRSAIYSIALGLSLGGCVKWQAETAAPAAVMSTNPKVMRIQRRDGVVLELVRVEIANDTLTGLQPGSARAGRPYNRVSIPVAEIARIGSRRADIRRIAAAVVAAPLAYFAGGFLIGR